MFVLGLILSIETITFSCAIPTIPSEDHCKKPPRLERAEFLGDGKVETFPLDHVAHYICRPGYLRTTHIQMVCKEGTWIWKSKGECKKKSCGSPREIEFGSFEVKEGDGFVFGAIVEYSCDPGYQMISKHKTIECLANGWSKGVPHCAARLCPPVEDDSVIVSSLVMDDEYTVGHVINLKCKDSKSKLNGPSQIFCTSDGTWNEDPPTCKGTCTVQNEKMNEHNLQVKNYRMLPVAHNEVIEFECAPGYEISDTTSLTIKCNHGVLTYPTCHLKARLCPPVEDESVRVLSTVFNKEYTAGHIIKLECKNPNNKLNGPSQIHCTSDGTWNIDPPTCKGQCTVQIDKMKQHNVQLKTYGMLHVAHNEVIEFKCVPGYKISDSKYLTTKCNEGVITYPTCNFPETKIRKKTCPPPPEVLFGEKMEEIKQEYVLGSSVQFKCLNYFKLEGKKIIKCRNGVWDHPPVCLSPCTLNDNYIKGNNTFVSKPIERYLKHNETVKFNCLPTFSISSPKLLKVKCLNGTLKYPQCVNTGSCALNENTMIKNNITVKTVNKHCGSQNLPNKCGIKSYKENDTIGFTCLPGYEISGHEKLKVKCHRGIIEYPKCFKIYEITVEPSEKTETGIY